jgi:hypothetical protein
MKRLLILALVAGLISVGSGAFAQFRGADPLIVVDENGNSLIQFPDGPPSSLDFAVTSDPGPGGQSNVLTYDLGGPPDLTAGDVILTEPGDASVTSDIIRFNPAGTGDNPNYDASLLIYSDEDDKTLSLADGPFPTDLYANQLTLPEEGSEGDDGILYEPTPGQPGFVDGFQATYLVFSDGTFAAPEPSSVAVFGIGALCFAAFVLRARRRNRALA